jgi:lipoate-protein ligase A
MTAPTLRLLPYAAADGPHNMAADEALLAAAAAGVASLRFYGWSAPTVSLGYFQPAAERLAFPRLAALPWVRRATGGEALVHDREVTYALALPAGPPWQRAGASWPCRMHAVIAAALATLGAAGGHGVACGAERRLGPFLCFQNQTRGDLVIAGHKVAGSAQRRQRGATLQHGGILLAASPHAPELPGLRELTGRDCSAADVAAAVARALADDTGWVVAAGGWSPDERATTERLATEKYGSDEWAARR